MTILQQSEFAVDTKSSRTLRALEFMRKDLVEYFQQMLVHRNYDNHEEALENCRRIALIWTGTHHPFNTYLQSPRAHFQLQVTRRIDTLKRYRCSATINQKNVYNIQINTWPEKKQR